MSGFFLLSNVYKFCIFAPLKFNNIKGEIMWYGYRGVLLGTALSLFMFCKQLAKDSDYFSAYIRTEQEEAVLPESMSIICKPTLYSSDTVISQPATTFDVVCAYIHDNNFCKRYYDMSSYEIERLMKVSYERVVSEILKRDHLSSKQMAELWCLYKCGCHRKKEVEKCQKDLLKKLHQRKENFERDQKRKQMLEKQKLVEQQRLEHIYHANVLAISEQGSLYSKDRQLALQKTKEQQYKKYKQSRNLDEQVVGFCMAKHIDYKQLQQSDGTAMQQQLYDEVADCYKKIARWFCQPSFAQGVLASQSIELAQCVAQATEAEAMQLAIALSDLAHGCADTVSSIIAGASDAVEGLIDIVTNPIETAKHVGLCLGKVMNWVAEAMVHADPDSLGWFHYAQLLEQEHHYDAQLAQQVVATIQDWVVCSSVQEKVRVGTRCMVDVVLYGNLSKLLSQASKICCGLIADIPELRFLGEFSDVYAEYELVTDLGEVGLRNIEDLGLSVLKSDLQIIDSVVKNVSKVERNMTFGDKIIYWIEKNKNLNSKRGANPVASNLNARIALRKKLSALEEAESICVKKRVLLDGRIRYYESETASATPGPTRGSAHVTEYDPKFGRVRAWRECYDHKGNVNRVRPKMKDGQWVLAQHYPPIGKEIEYFKQLAEKFN